MEEFKAKKAKILDELDLEGNKIMRDSINKNLAIRDAKRIAKQKKEDDGLVSSVIRPFVPEPIIEKVIDINPELKKSIMSKKIKPIIKKNVQDLKIKDVLVEKIIPEPKPKIEVIEKVIEKQEHAKYAAEHAANKIEEAILSIEDIPEHWIGKYEFETGKKAIWRGAITNGFKEFIKLNNLD